MLGPLSAKIEDFYSSPENYHIIAVDGGSKHDPRAAVRVGDGDSTDILLTHKLDPHKNFTDLAYALTLIPYEATVGHLRGFMGGRKDHQLAVWGECYHYLTKNPQFKKFHFQDHTLYQKGHWKISQKGLFGIIALEWTQIKITGKVEYPLETPTRIPPLSGHGVSNVGSGNIQVESDRPFLFFHTLV